MSPATATDQTIAISRITSILPWPATTPPNRTVTSPGATKPRNAPVSAIGHQRRRADTSNAQRAAEVLDRLLDVGDLDDAAAVDAEADGQQRDEQLALGRAGASAGRGTPVRRRRTAAGTSSRGGVQRHGGIGVGRVPGERLGSIAGRRGVGEQPDHRRARAADERVLGAGVARAAPSVASIDGHSERAAGSRSLTSSSSARPKRRGRHRARTASSRSARSLGCAAVRAGRPRRRRRRSTAARATAARARRSAAAARSAAQRSPAPVASTRAGRSCAGTSAPSRSAIAAAARRHRRRRRLARRAAAPRRRRPSRRPSRPRPGRA